MPLYTRNTNVIHHFFQHKFLLISHQSIYIYYACLFVFVCLFVSNKRQHGWADRAQIFVTSRGPRKGLWMIKMSKMASIKIRFSLNFWKFWTIVWWYHFFGKLLRIDECKINKRFLKDFSLCHKLWFSNHYIFATEHGTVYLRYFKLWTLFYWLI